MKLIQANCFPDQPKEVRSVISGSIKYRNNQRPQFAGLPVLVSKAPLLEHNTNKIS